MPFFPWISSEAFPIATFGICTVLSCRVGFLFAVTKKYKAMGQPLTGYTRAAANWIVEWLLLVSCSFFLPLVNVSLNPTDQWMHTVMLVVYLSLIGLCSSIYLFWYASRVKLDTIESITLNTYDLPGPAGGWVPYLTPKILWRGRTLHSRLYGILNLCSAFVLFSLLIVFLLQLVPYHMYF
ncbi:MAG: hypothetical protein WA734_12350 [Candidatus Acidiferrales bacterium]